MLRISAQGAVCFWGSGNCAAIRDERLIVNCVSLP
jgi:hypothetical protein